MNDRDPNNLNDHVKISWPDAFGEPEGSYSFDCVWRNSYKVFTATKFWAYRICSAICAIPFSFCWGLYFACASFYYVWYVTPWIKAYFIQIGCMGRLWALCLKSFCDPFFESIAMVLSKITINMGGGGGGGDSKAWRCLLFWRATELVLWTHYVFSYLPVSVFTITGWTFLSVFPARIWWIPGYNTALLLYIIVIWGIQKSLVITTLNISFTNLVLPSF